VPLFCQVQFRDDVVALIRTEGATWGIGEPRRLLEQIEKRWIFYTVEWQELLRPIWKMHHQRFHGTSHLVERSPLLDEAGGEPHCWREGRGDSPKPHIYVPGKPGDSRDRDEDFLAHRWVQAQLVNLGLERGERAKMEHDIPSGRIDVVWFESKIAWEVDLTPQSRSGQENRAKCRKAAGFDMIAVFDSADV
jgi:hypothetical protein